MTDTRTVALAQSRADATFGPCSASPRPPRSFVAEQTAKRVDRQSHVVAVGIASRTLPSPCIIDDDQAHAAVGCLDMQLGGRFARARRRHPIANAVIDERELDVLGVIGAKLDANIAMRGRPTRGDTADQQR